MKKCPKCGNLSVTYDSYFGIVRCLTNFCDHIEGESKDEQKRKVAGYGRNGYFSFEFVERQKRKTA